MKQRPVYFAGGALLNAHGAGIAPSAAACLDGIVAPSNLRFSYLGREVVLPYFNLPQPAAPTTADLLAQVAAQALRSAAVDAADRAAMPLLIGTSSLDIGEQERHYAAHPDAVPIATRSQGDIAEVVAHQLGLSGPRHTLFTACSAGANALLYAAWMIRSGQAEHALVLGTELRNMVSILGFHGMLLLAPDACRPFDANRRGIVLGEAVAAAVLSARKPGPRAWRLRGGATLCDTSHPTNSSAGKIAQVLREALADAGRTPRQIACIKAHGTGTVANDEAESTGLAQLFTGQAAPPLTTLKAVLGHTLGACGVMETLVLLECLNRGRIPAGAGCLAPDPALPIHPLSEPASYSGGAVLLNYFGFGGNNCALVLEPEEQADA